MVKHSSNAPLQIRLTEPVIFLRGPSTGTDFRGRPQTVRDGQPAMVRGLLTLKLHKPTRIRNISISLEGKSRTEWPEGIGPRRTDTFEEHEIISETTTFFSAADAAAAKAARRSQSVGPGGLAQYDLDSDEDTDYGLDDDAYDLPRERGRGRALPRSSSVLPSNPDDWMSWHRDGRSRPGSRAVSPEPGLTSRTASALSLSNLRVDRLAERGPSPAYTPSYTPPLGGVSSPDFRGRQTSLREVASSSESNNTDGLARPGSHAALGDVNEGVAWRPTTPTGHPDEAITFPAVADPGPPTSTAIRFQSPERAREDGAEVLDSPAPAAGAEPASVTASPSILPPLTSSPSILATAAAVPPGAPLAALPSRAESLRTIDSAVSSRSSRSEYHPVVAGHQTAATTPTNETPPTGSPQCGSPLPSQRTSLHDDESRHGRRRSSALRPAATPGSSSGPSPIASTLPSPRSSTDLQEQRRGHSRTPGSVTANGSIGTSEPPSSTASHFSEDSRGRANHHHHHHHHKFSLTAALRGLSHDVKERVRSHSRPTSRASSRTRGSETPRTPHFHLPESVPHSAPMSRNASANGPVRSAVEDLPHREHRSRSRNHSPARHDDSRGRSRHRMFGGKEEEEEIHNWKEFRKGVYNYPISFPIPLNAPPTIHAEFGSVQYKLKATVVRVGALTPNLVEELEVVMVAGPQEDDMEETDNVIVERQWEEQMRYQIALSGKAFPIGGVIPMSIRLMPLMKCKIYRLTVALEEKTDYYAVGRKVARHETPRRFVLFSAKNHNDSGKKEKAEPLLPILSDSVSAVKDSPLAELARNAALNNPREFADFSNPEDDVYASLLDPMGPWHLEKDLVVPDCNTRIKFTTKHEQTNISIGHWLKVTIRVERGDDVAVDSKGRRKQFDIIIETPIKILDCRVNPQYNSLPSYERLGADQQPLHQGCSVHAKTGGSQLLPKSVLIGTSAAAAAAAANAAHAVLDVALTPFGNHSHNGNHHSNHGNHSHHGSHHGSHFASPAASPQLRPENPHSHSSHSTLHNNHHGHHPHVAHHDEDTLLERNIVYDRLMSGQETETGELPPTYGEAVANAIRSARSASRAASRSHSAAPSVPPSRSDSRAPSRSNSRAPSRSRARMYIED